MCGVSACHLRWRSARQRSQAAKEQVRDVQPQWPREKTRRRQAGVRCRHAPHLEAAEARVAALLLLLLLLLLNVENGPRNDELWWRGRRCWRRGWYCAGRHYGGRNVAPCTAASLPYPPGPPPRWALPSEGRKGAHAGLWSHPQPLQARRNSRGYPCERSEELC